jgi:putative MATE family efflux protein
MQTKLTQIGETDSEYQKMIKGKIAPLLAKLAIPTIISMLVSAIYNTADTYFVSQIDNSASSAISVVFSLMSLIQALGFTIGMGSGALISRHLGTKKIKEASTVASTAVCFGLILGVLFSVFGLIYCKQLMQLLGSTDTALPYAIMYGKYILYSTPVMILSFILNNILRSEGKAKLSMIGLAIGGVLNIFLDPLFIQGFQMGVSGAGLATMISQIVSFLLLSSFFLFKKSTTVLSISNIHFSFSLLGRILAYGSPTLLRQGCASFSTIALNFLGKPYGDAFISALGITTKIYLFIRNIIIGVGQGYQPFLGYNFGARRIDRVKKGLRFTLLVDTLIALIGTILVLLFSKQLVTWFRNDEEVIAYGKVSIKLLAISLPLLGFTTVVNQSLQVTGFSLSASFLASCRQGIVYFPLIFLLHNIWGSTGLELTQPLSDLITGFITVPFLFFYLHKLSQIEKQTSINNSTTA